MTYCTAKQPAWIQDTSWLTWHVYIHFHGGCPIALVNFWKVLELHKFRSSLFSSKVATTTLVQINVKECQIGSSQKNVSFPNLGFPFASCSRPWSVKHVWKYIYIYRKHCQTHSKPMQTSFIAYPTKHLPKKQNTTWSCAVIRGKFNTPRTSYTANIRCQPFLAPLKFVKSMDLGLRKCLGSSQGNGWVIFEGLPP